MVHSMPQITSFVCFALHFLPRINKSLKNFQSSWNHHSIRTEHDSTPTQLFISGALRLCNMGMISLDFLTLYGIDEVHLTTNEDDVVELLIPEVNVQLTSD